MPITSISASIINGLKKLATNLVYAYHPPITKPSSTIFLLKRPASENILSLISVRGRIISVLRGLFDT